MTATRPDSDVGVPLLRQAWRQVTFLHWRVDAGLLQRHLPAPLTVDEHDGSGWLSLTPLQLADVRVPGLPPVPGLSTFPEVNLRTYVRTPDGRAGLWFFALDADSLWITFGARLLLGVPYMHSRLHIDTNDSVRYTGRRTGSDVEFDIRVRPGEPVAPGDLDRWLTHRSRAFSRHAGRVLEIPVTHEPWPLRTATVLTLREGATAAAGLPPPPADLPLVHYSEGVTDVAFGAARPL